MPAKGILQTVGGIGGMTSFFHLLPLAHIMVYYYVRFSCTGSSLLGRNQIVLCVLLNQQNEQA